MSFLQALGIALLQGLTELFPISSLGHAVVVPPLLGWDVDQSGPAFLPFLVVLHVGTALALLLYFWRDWLALFLGVIGRGADAAGHRRLLAMMVVATIPAVILGFAFEHKLRSLFGSPAIVSGFLILNGVMLLVGERVRRRLGDANHGAIEDLTWSGAIIIGCWQCLALLPGLSRSGATILGGLLKGMSHAAAARFSFLIALPIIAGAAVLEVPKLMHGPGLASIGATAVIAGLVAGVAAYASLWALMRWFRKQEFEALDPFGWYCCGIGAVSLAYFLGASGF